MRIPVFCAIISTSVVLMAVAACSQTTFESTHRVWTPPGTYAAPFQPLLTTPSVSAEDIATPLITLDPVFPAAGATNATAGNEAGASAFITGKDLTSTAQFATQAWYGPASSSEAQTEPVEASTETTLPARAADLGTAQFEVNRSVKEIMVKPTAPAKRVYTEADVARMNDSNGSVRFHGQTEHVD